MPFLLFSGGEAYFPECQRFALSQIDHLGRKRCIRQIIFLLYYWVQFSGSIWLTTNPQSRSELFIFPMFALSSLLLSLLDIEHQLSVVLAMQTHTSQTYLSSLMSAVHPRLYFSPVLCANDRPPKTSLTSHSNQPRRAVIHHHAWLTSQLKSSSKYQAPVSSRSVGVAHKHEQSRYFASWWGDPPPPALDLTCARWGGPACSRGNIQTGASPRFTVMKKETQIIAWWKKKYSFTILSANSS